MNPLMEQLHDIEGVDAVSPWPLAIGWQLLGFLLLLLTALLLFSLYRRRRFNRSWKRGVLEELRELEEELNEDNAQETAAQLSEYMRRIAVYKYSRKECAGLVGESWLIFLKERDPRQFDWVERGKLLIDAPYAPEGKGISRSDLKPFFSAIKRWVR